MYKCVYVDGVLESRELVNRSTYQAYPRYVTKGTKPPETEPPETQAPPVEVPPTEEPPAQPPQTSDPGNSVPPTEMAEPALRYLQIRHPPYKSGKGCAHCLSRIDHRKEKVCR